MGSCCSHLKLRSAGDSTVIVFDNNKCVGIHREAKTVRTPYHWLFKFICEEKTIKNFVFHPRKDENYKNVSGAEFYFNGTVDALYSKIETFFKENCEWQVDPTTFFDRMKVDLDIVSYIPWYEKFVCKLIVCFPTLASYRTIFSSLLQSCYG